MLINGSACSVQTQYMKQQAPKMPYNFHGFAFISNMVLCCEVRFPFWLNLISPLTPSVCTHTNIHLSINVHMNVFIMKGRM